MRILYIVHQFLPEFSAGTEQFTLSMAMAAQAEGHAVAVLTRFIDNPVGQYDPNIGLYRETIQGIPTYYASLNGPNLEDIGFLFGKEIVSDLTENFMKGFDVVHITHSFRNIPIIECVIRNSIPYIITATDFFLACHRINYVNASGQICSGSSMGGVCGAACAIPGLHADDHEKRFRRMSAILGGAAAVVACSPTLAQALEREFPEVPIRTQGHGIDLLRFPHPSRRKKEAPVIFGAVGTMSEAKGTYVLVEAFLQADMDARLRLYGPCFDAELRNWLDDKAASDGRLEVYGPLQSYEVPQALLSLDVLCIPTLVPETYSIIMYEGFAAGLPALVSDVGHPSTVVGRLECGKVISTGSVTQWSQAMAALVGEPTKLAEMSCRVPLPLRREEEAFVYMQLYRLARYQGGKSHMETPV